MSMVILSGSSVLCQTPTASTIPAASLSATTLASTLLTAADLPAGMTSQGITNGSTWAPTRSTLSSWWVRHPADPPRLHGRMCG